VPSGGGVRRGQEGRSARLGSADRRVRRRRTCILECLVLRRPAVWVWPSGVALLPARREARTLDLDPTAHVVAGDSRVGMFNVCASVLWSLERIILLSGFFTFILFFRSWTGIGSLSFVRGTSYVPLLAAVSDALGTATAKEVQ